MVTLPVSVTMPSWLSKQQAIGAFGCAGGLLFGDYAAATIISRTGLTGSAAMAGSALTKIAIGAAMFYGAGKIGGGGATALGLASVGCFASVIIDVVRYVWPTITGAGARLGAAMRAGRAAVPSAAVRLGPAGAPAGIRVRAETPSAYALGGF